MARGRIRPVQGAGLRRGGGSGLRCHTTLPIRAPWESGALIDASSDRIFPEHRALAAVSPYPKHLTICSLDTFRPEVQRLSLARTH